MAWTDIDLSTAFLPSGGSGPLGQWDGTGIISLHGFPDIMDPGFTVSPTGYYEFEATYDTSDLVDFDAEGGFWVYAADGDDQTHYDDSPFNPLYDNDLGDVTVHTFTIGPGIAGWDPETGAGRVYPIFESDAGCRLISLRWQPGTAPAAPPPPSYTIGGVTSPSGAATVAAAVELTIPAVTSPALALSAEGLSEPGMWWRFTATQSRTLIVDAGLSYGDVSHVTTNTQPKVSVGLYGTADGGPVTTFDDLISIDSGNSGAQGPDGTLVSCGHAEAELAAGNTYYVALYQRSDSATARLVCRINDYGVITEWTQGDDLAWVLNPSTGLGHPRSLPPVTAFPGDSFGPEHQATFTGSYQLNQALGGPAPSDDSGTYDVLWRNARAGQAGTDWWSPDPLNPDVDIHAAWNGGPGTPVYKDDGRALEGRGSEADDFVGVVWGVDKSLAPATAGYTTWAHCWRFEVTSITRDFITSPSGGASNPTDFPDVPGGFSGSFEWETDAPQLVGLAASPDEAVDVGNTNGTCLVYAKVVPTEDGDGWGPDAFGDVDAHADGWAGGLDLPESFPAKQDVELTATAGAWAGGSYPWVDLTSSLAAILAQEAIDGAEFAHDGTYPGALRFVSLPKDLVAREVPTDGVAPDPDDDEVLGRNRQVIALQIIMRPSRHRWIGNPGYTPVDSGFVPPLLLTNRNDMFSSAPSLVIVNSRQGSNRITGYL